MTEPSLFIGGEAVPVTYLGVANATERTAPRAVVPPKGRNLAVEAQANVEHDHWCNYPKWQFVPDEIVCDCWNARVIKWLLTVDTPEGAAPVDRTALVALLDAWQAWEDARYAPTDVEGPAYWEHQRSVAFDAFYEAMSAFAEAVDL